MTIERQFQRNVLSLLLIEWFIWVIVTPLLILLLISLITGVNFFELIQSLGPKGKNAHLLISHLFFVGLILAPICSYYGFLTRPLFKIKKTKMEFEHEKKEIIDMVKKVTKK